MKSVLLLLLLSMGVATQAQLVPCRPRTCVIDYNYHNDNLWNADRVRIDSARPEILIDNTPHGFWGQVNGHTGCLPRFYTSLGIKVFSYITGGYEGTHYGGDTSLLSANMARIDSIFTIDSASGVFLDNVTAFPDSVRKVYLSAISARCASHGLLLIFNTGVDTFDGWLMSHCDYILSDEHYDGVRAPTAWERPYLGRVLVVTEGVTTPATAAARADGARAQGFGYSYACDSYTVLPAWLVSYLALSTQAPATPLVSLVGSLLQSTAPFGNQWYRAPSTLLPGATNQTYAPSTAGLYYSIVTLDGCPSDTSNLVGFVPMGLGQAPAMPAITVAPNPASDVITVSIGADGVAAGVALYTPAGKLVLQGKADAQTVQLNVSDLPAGMYLLTVSGPGFTVTRKVAVVR